MAANHCNLNSYLSDIEELLIDTMGNPQCTPHEVSLIGAWAERLTQKARRHSRLVSRSPFSTDQTCPPSSAGAASDPYPAFRSERITRLPKDHALPKAPSAAALASFAPVASSDLRSRFQSEMMPRQSPHNPHFKQFPAPYQKGERYAELHDMSPLSESSLQGNVVSTELSRVRNNGIDRKESLQLSQKRVRSESHDAPSLQSNVVSGDLLGFSDYRIDRRDKLQPIQKRVRSDGQLVPGNRSHTPMYPNDMKSGATSIGAAAAPQNPKNSPVNSVATPAPQSPKSCTDTSVGTPSSQLPKDSLDISVPPLNRRVSTKKNDKDRAKLIAIISSWSTGEREKIGPPGLFEPLILFLTLEKNASPEIFNASKAEWTAFQVTTMIASLGSSEAVAGCRKIIIRLRDSESFASLPEQSKHPRSFLGCYKPLASPMDNLVKLAPRFFDDPLTLPKEHDFEYRHYVMRFCECMVLQRDILNKDGEMSYEKAMDEAYASVIMKIKPRTKRFRADGALGPGFKAHQSTLFGNTLRGFRWIVLVNRFGLGILALYQSQGKYGHSADINIETRDLKDEEFQLLLSHLDAEDNADFNWLKRICSLINPYITQGLQERLTLPMLNMEYGPEDQVLACNERSEELAKKLMPIQTGASSSG